MYRTDRFSKYAFVPSFFAALSVLFVVGVPSSAHSAVGAYECKTLRQDVGREDADKSAPLLRRVDGTLQIVEVNDVYYTSFDPVVDDLNWLELYGAQSQRGNSFVGFFQFENFSCVK